MSRLMRVLVVDDDFMVARIHGRFVEQTDGFEVVGTAHTGVEALEMAAALRPDLVLLDVHLPDLSGLEVLERLRGQVRERSDGQAGQGGDVAVLMVTAERGAPAVSAALHGGALHYLVKPFEYADLAERLRHVAATLDTLTGPPEVDQATIDRVFGAGRALDVPQRLPKGLSPETADLVLSSARAAGEISASEAADVVGLSRVTARRYLEHFVDIGVVEVRLQYGGTGRPERRYRITG